MDGIRFVTKKLSELIPDPENPRVITPEAKAGLELSIKKFGLVAPIIWNEETDQVVGGHQRLKVLQDMGIEETEVIVWSGSREEQRALNVILNNVAIMGDWDEEALTARLHEIREDLDVEDFLALRLEKLRMEILEDAGEGNPDWKELWQGMPEFDMDDEEPHRKIVVSFPDDEAVIEFAKRLGLDNVTDRTRSVWFPKDARRPEGWIPPSGYRYVDEDEKVGEDDGETPQEGRE